MSAGGLYLLVSIFSGRLFGWIERWARRGEPFLGGSGR
jgi:polar amino acid transport system permease protein